MTVSTADDSHHCWFFSTSLKFAVEHNNYNHSDTTRRRKYFRLMTPKPTPTLQINRQAGLRSSSPPHESFFCSTHFIPVHTPHSGPHSVSFRSTLFIQIHTVSFRSTLFIPIHTPHCNSPHSSFYRIYSHWPHSQAESPELFSRCCEATEVNAERYTRNIHRSDDRVI